MLGAELIAKTQCVNCVFKLHHCLYNKRRKGFSAYVKGFAKEFTLFEVKELKCSGYVPVMMDMRDEWEEEEIWEAFGSKYWNAPLWFDSLS